MSRPFRRIASYWEYRGNSPEWAGVKTVLRYEFLNLNLPTEEGRLLAPNFDKGMFFGLALTPEKTLEDIANVLTTSHAKLLEHLDDYSFPLGKIHLVAHLKSSTGLEYFRDMAIGKYHLELAHEYESYLLGEDYEEESNESESN